MCTFSGGHCVRCYSVTTMPEHLALIAEMWANGVIVIPLKVLGAHFGGLDQS